MEHGSVVENVVNVASHAKTAKLNHPTHVVARLTSVVA